MNTIICFVAHPHKFLWVVCPDKRKCPLVNGVLAQFSIIIIVCT